MPTQDAERIVIVGAGIAGVRAALTLRDSGFAGQVILLSEEAHPPYDRPPLSKSVLCDPDGERRIGLDPKGGLIAADVELRLSARCVGIDKQMRTVALASGEVLAYDRLILATGSRVRTVPMLPPDAPSVHYLRTLDDALALRLAAEGVRRVAVIGAGVIGLEVAASLTGLGHQVTVIDPAGRAMSRSTSLALGALLERRHIAEGVVLRFNVGVAAVHRRPDGILLHLSDGTELAADIVVVGVGVAPNVEIALAAGIDVAPQGIVVDALGRTSDPAIFAVGEVAFHTNVALGRRDRQETWAHAAAHGEHVARAIMGPQDGYSERPSYWTDQYDLNVQVIGIPAGDQDVVRGRLEDERGLIFHLVGERIAGVTAINAARELRVARKLLDLPVADAARLADLTVDLKDLAATHMT